MSQSQIKVETLHQKRYLLQSVLTSSVPPKAHILGSPSEITTEMWDILGTAPFVAIDFETCGNDFSHPDFRSVGVGLSTGELSIYVDLTTTEKTNKQTFLLRLSRLPLIAHNVMFDGGVMYRENGNRHANWQFCTYGLTKQLSSESKLVRAGLKDLQLELLGWTETNETELDNWLVENGYHNQAKRPLKGEMWRAPREILGHYCLLDAYSAYLLFTRVLQPAMDRIPKQVLIEYHQRDFITEIEFLIEQQITGITIDKERLVKYGEELRERISTLQASFICHPDVCAHIAQFNQDFIRTIQDSEPAKFLKPPTLGDEPPATTKSGKPSVNWDKWSRKRQLIENWDNDPDNISANWQKWKAKYDIALTEQHFNLNSGQHLQWLFYTAMGKPILVRTDSDQPATDEDALLQMGEAAKVLIDYKLAVKELGYVEAYLEHCRLDSVGYWRGHPQFKCPGTLTGRLSGAGGTNYQQLPKSIGFLSCFRPLEPSRIWVDFDVTALEPVVMTELTRDPGLLSIYGPTAKSNDIYLYFSSFIKGLGEDVRAAGYDPENPTKEGIANAKKKCKEIRNIAKTVVLAKTYLAGARKIHQTLQLNGIDLPFEEVQEISNTYDRVFAGIRNFGRQLEEEWRENGGYVFNGLGLPVTVSEDYLKDLGNRVVQGSGHIILMRILRIFAKCMKVKRIPFRWVICDFHDQFIVEVAKEHAQVTKDLIAGEVLAILNKELGGLIPIKGDPQIVRSMAEVKIENFREPEEPQKGQAKDQEHAQSGVPGPTGY